jgi:NADPH-dependent 2,4-dienoyl-CoA reductase/sulfur reductase-like enzyme
MDTIVVVGASLAGLRAAEALRSEGFDGTIRMVGGEDRLPYDRPPLSKQILAGDWQPDRLVLQPDPVADLDVDLHLASWATGLDPGRKVVTTTEGDLTFDGCVLATGSIVRTLPGQPDLAGIHTLRTVDDALALRADLDAGPARVVVIGAGFIGAEVAATARGRGLEVTILEGLPVPLQRGLGDRMGMRMADVHRAHGVDLRLGVAVQAIEGGQRVERVRLADGSVLPADVVVVGIGVRPATDWLEGSGLTLDDGVVCDHRLVAAPGVVAAGDLARWPNRRFDTMMRVEHWENAVEQGRAAALSLLHGDAAPAFAPVPWFWSDQYDTKIQLAGWPGADATVQVIEEDESSGRLVALYGRGGKVVGVLGLNRPRQVMQYRMQIEAGLDWDDAIAAGRA